MREMMPVKIKNINRKLKTASLTMLNFDEYKIKIFWLRFTRVNECFNDKEHSHSFFELHYVTSGRFSISINNVTSVINQDEYILISPRAKHKIISQSSDFQKLVWGFEIEKGEVSFDEFCAINSATYTQKQWIDNLFSSEFNEFGDVSVKLGLGLFLSRSLDFKTKNEKIYEEGSEIFERVERFVDDNINMSFTSEDIAMTFGISSRHLSRICVRFTGLTFGKYLREQKINKACALLSQYTVKETAEMLGYSDEFAFSKSFRTVIGKTPSVWRKDNK